MFEYLLSGCEKETIATDPLWNLLNPSVLSSSVASLAVGKVTSTPATSLNGQDEFV